jgi:hypothetical protein
MDAEVSQNVILAVIATPLISALVDVMKRRGPTWLNEGMAPALVAEVLGIALGIVAYFASPALYGAAPEASLGIYIFFGFNVGLAAVGAHSQFKAGTAQKEE